MKRDIMEKTSLEVGLKSLCAVGRKDMNRKCIAILIMSALFLIPACSAAPAAAPEEPLSEQSEELSLTLEELKEYEGQDSAPAYIAVDGIIYDVSDVKAWNGGIHNGFSAGNDVTDIIKSQSPHGLSVLGNLPEIGIIEE